MKNNEGNAALHWNTTIPSASMHLKGNATEGSFLESPQMDRNRTCYLHFKPVGAYHYTTKPRSAIFYEIGSELSQRSDRCPIRWVRMSWRYVAITNQVPIPDSRHYHVNIEPSPIFLVTHALDAFIEFRVDLGGFLDFITQEPSLVGARAFCRCTSVLVAKPNEQYDAP